MHSFANMYGAFDVVLYFVIIQLFWLLINLILILSYKYTFHFNATFKPTLTVYKLEINTSKCFNLVVVIKCG